MLLILLPGIELYFIEYQSKNKVQKSLGKVIILVL